jgi:hypothetical protein
VFAQFLELDGDREGEPRMEMPGAATTAGLATRLPGSLPQASW